MKIEKLRKLLINLELDGLIIPSWDVFMGEEIDDCDKNLEFLTGFSGSHGIGLILQKNLLLFTDGRYLQQAKNQCPDFQIIDLAEISLPKWCQENLPANLKIAFNSMLHSNAQIENWGKYFKFTPIRQDLVDRIWQNMPKRTESKPFFIPESLAGKSSESKIEELVAILKKNSAEHLFIFAPENLCWLMNLRAHDVAHSPIFNGFGVLSDDGKMQVFSQEGSGLSKLTFADFEKFCQNLRNAKIIIDEARVPYFFFEILKKRNKIINMPEPIFLLKSIKNQTEIEAIKNAHIEDGRSFGKFLRWFDGNVNENLTELEISEKLLEFRKENPNFIKNSFASIVGIGPNASIIHHHPTPENDRKVGQDEIVLIDSGGQYLGQKPFCLGTTDVTRVLPLKAEISQEIKKRYTQILKGHIRLASAIFPKGTTGAHLDALSRLDLWEECQDYAHGTGHGVGAFLNVHEGPQSISKRSFQQAIEAGMILSIEPGYYEAGKFGLRIENLYLVEEENAHFLKFSPLTLIPINEIMVDFSMLSAKETGWLKDYNAGCVL